MNGPAAAGASSGAGRAPSPGAWFQGVRPRTLTAALSPILVATALAHALSRPAGLAHPELSLFALLSAVFIQIGTNLFNDALDFKRGADTEERIGPKRVTQSGLLTYRAVWWGGIAAFAIAAAFSAPLILAAGKVIIVIGLFSFVAGYLYTGGPYPLAYLGLGDVFVLVFFGWVAVLGMMAVHGVAPGLPAWVAGTQVGLLAISLIAINNFRDSVGDRKVGKKTLAVRLGPVFARAEIVGSLLAPFVIGAYWWTQDLRFAALLPLLALPLAAKTSAGVLRTEPSPAFNRFLGKAAGTQLVFGALLAVGLLIGR